MNERALAWLEKQLRKKKIALFLAENKPSISEKEIADINGSIDVLEHLIAVVEDAERDKADTVYVDREAFLRDAEKTKAEIEAAGQTFTAADVLYMLQCADGANVVQARDNELFLRKVRVEAIKGFAERIKKKAEIRYLEGDKRFACIVESNFIEKFAERNGVGRIMTKPFEWIDAGIELPADTENAVLVICSGTAGSVRLEDAYELAWYYPREDKWILEAYTGEADIRVSWWRYLPEAPEG